MVNNVVMWNGVGTRIVIQSDDREEPVRTALEQRNYTAGVGLFRRGDGGRAFLSSGATRSAAAAAAATAAPGAAATAGAAAAVADGGLVDPAVLADYVPENINMPEAEIVVVAEGQGDAGDCEEL